MDENLVLQKTPKKEADSGPGKRQTGHRGKKQIKYELAVPHICL